MTAKLIEIEISHNVEAMCYYVTTDRYKQSFVIYSYENGSFCSFCFTTLELIKFDLPIANLSIDALEFIHLNNEKQIMFMFSLSHMLLILRDFETKYYTFIPIILTASQA